MKDITFTHTLSSGRIITIAFIRKAQQRPKTRCNFDYAELSAIEREEYLPWRNNVVATLMSTLTPGEIVAAIP